LFFISVNFAKLSLPNINARLAKGYICSATLLYLTL
jgi:hypothetical protein